MARSNIPPLLGRFPIVDPQTGTPSLQFQRLWQELFGNEAGTYTDAANAAALAGDAVPQSRLINTVTPIMGGGDGTADLTLSHNTSGVTAGAYTNANITVDADGHVTAAASGGSGGGGSFTAITNYDFAIDGGTSQVVAAVGSYPEILVQFTNVAGSGTANWKCVQVSTDGGVTWLTATTDYSTVNANGSVSDETAIYAHTTSTTLGRYGIVHVFPTVAQPFAECPLRSPERINTTGITHVRAICWTLTATTPITGGKINIYGR